MQREWTKPERHEVYVLALEFLRFDISAADSGYTICLNIQQACTALFGNEYNQWDIAYQFPEFMSKKPADVTRGNFWWPSNRAEVRIKVLEQCIRETI